MGYRLDLDLFNAALSRLDSDEDRAAFLLGLQRGLNGGAAREGASSPYLEGHAIGAESASHALKVSMSKSKAGQHGGRPSHKSKPPVVSNMKANEKHMLSVCFDAVEGSTEDQQNQQMKANEKQNESICFPFGKPYIKNTPSSTTENSQSTSLPTSPVPTATTSLSRASKPAFNPDDFASFYEACWKPYPSRKGPEGKALGKGKQQQAFERASKVRAKWGLGWDDLANAVRAYHHHPNVKAGFVQAAEVFWGEEGHWLECHNRFRERGLPREMDGGGVPGIHLEGARGRELGADARPRLAWSGPAGLPAPRPAVHLPDLRDPLSGVPQGDGTPRGGDHPAHAYEPPG